MPTPRPRAWLCCALLALGLSGCTFSNRQPEALGPEPGGSDAAAEGGARDASAVEEDAATSGSAGAAPMPSPGSTATPPPTPDAGGSGSSGSTAPTPDAGSPPSDDDAAQVDDVTCAFELSACIILDPLNFEACFRMNMERCKLLAADGGIPKSPSPACSMQTAQCVVQHPDKAQECLDMQESCML